MSNENYIVDCTDDIIALFEEGEMTIAQSIAVLEVVKYALLSGADKEFNSKPEGATLQ